MSSHSNHRYRVLPSSSSSSSSLNQKLVCCSSSRIIKSAMRGNPTCPICLNRVKDSSSSAAVLTVCMHVYCIDCIRKWSKLKRNCPLCNAFFDSWFLKTRVSTTTTDFIEEKLSDLDETKNTTTAESSGSDREDYRAQRRRFSMHNRVLRGSVNNSERSRPLPWRRSFGRLRSFVSQNERQRRHREVGEVAERALQWRASIYSQGLQAVPLPSKYCLDQKILVNNDIKEKKRKQLEQWIQRELQAVLGDSDPSVIVHLCVSVFYSSLEEKHKAPADCLGIEHKFVEQLKPFLYEKTNMFWHELRCFALSVFDITTYDSVVVYE